MTAVQVRRGHASPKHVVVAVDVVHGREDFCRYVSLSIPRGKPAIAISESAWSALQERAAMQWLVIVGAPIENPEFRADFHVAEVRLKGKRGCLRGQSLPPGEARAQIVGRYIPFFSQEVHDVLCGMRRASFPLLVDLWPTSRAGSHPYRGAAIGGR